MRVSLGGVLTAYSQTRHLDTKVLSLECI